MIIARNHTTVKSSFASSLLKIVPLVLLHVILTLLTTYSCFLEAIAAKLFQEMFVGTANKKTYHLVRPSRFKWQICQRSCILWNKSSQYDHNELKESLDDMHSICAQRTICTHNLYLVLWSNHWDIFWFIKQEFNLQLRRLVYTYCIFNTWRVITAHR